MALPNQLVAIRLLCYLVIFAAVLSSASGIVAQDASPPQTHIVLAIEGGASVRFTLADGSSTNDVPLTVGQIISSRDIVITNFSQTVIILCVDGKIDIINGSQRVVCQQSPTVGAGFRWEDVPIGGTVRANNNIHIISPRNGVILDNRPTFVLSAAPQTGQRIVIKLLDVNQNKFIWQGNVTTREISFPLSSPLFAIRQGGTDRLRYQLELYEIDNQGREILINDPQEDIGFCIVTGSDRPAIETMLKSVTDANYPNSVNNEARIYARAVFYYSRGLYAEARAELITLLPSLNTLSQVPNPRDARVDQLTKAPMYYILLARASRGLGLLREGQEAYKWAEAMAAGLDDKITMARLYEERADILRGRLSEIKPNGPQPQPEIYDLYTQAYDLYDVLRDPISRSRVERKRDTVITPPNPSDPCG